MFITIQKTVKCSKCGSTSYESFSDAQHKGLRCLKCGHEKREPHQHLQTQTSDGTAWRSSDKPIEF